MTPSPYPGLRPFETAEHGLFFGRHQQVDELIQILRAQRFVVVSGVSGSGKSSLVRAGLIHALKRELLPISQHSWKFAHMMPGTNPIGGLRKALAAVGIKPDKAAGTNGSTEVRSHSETDELEQGGAALVREVAAAQAKTPDLTFALLLVVDQFEEIFRYAREGSSLGAANFVELLVETTRQITVPIYVVLTMRSDFIGDCTRFRGLPELVNRSQYLVPRMTQKDMTEAIVRPALGRKVEVESALVQRLLNDAQDDPRRLPLLQHALNRTWEEMIRAGAKGELTLEHYRATGTINGENGKSGALDVQASNIYSGLTAEMQDVAKALFRVIAERSATGRDTRRPCSVAKLEKIIFAPLNSAPDWQAGDLQREQLHRVIAAFQNHSLLRTADRGQDQVGGGEIADLSHESLMGAWGQLSNWIEKESRRIKDWLWLLDMERRRREENGQLLQGAQITTALNVFNNHPCNRFWAEHVSPPPFDPTTFEGVTKFVKDSIDKEKEQQVNEARARRYRLLLTWGPVAALLIGGGAWLWHEQRNRLLKLEDDKVASLRYKHAIRDGEANSLDLLQDLHTELHDRTSTRLNELEQARRDFVSEPSRQAATQIAAALREAQDAIVRLKNVAKKLALRPSVDEALENRKAELTSATQDSVKALAKAMEDLQADDGFTKALESALAMQKQQIEQATAKLAAELAKPAPDPASLRVGAESLDALRTEFREFLRTAGELDGTDHFTPTRTSVLATAEEQARSAEKRAEEATVAPPSPAGLKIGDDVVLKKENDPPESFTTSVRFVPGYTEDDPLIVTGGDNRRVRLFTAAGGGSLKEWSSNGEGQINELAISPTGTMGASASNGNTVRVYRWSASSPPVAQKVSFPRGSVDAFQRHSASVTTVTFNYDGSLIASASADKTVRVFDSRTLLQRYFSSPPLPNIVTSVTFARRPALRLSAPPFVVSACNDGIVRVHNFDNPDFRQLGKFDAPAHRAEFSADNRWVSASSADGTARIWTVNPPADFLTSPHHGPVHHAAFRPVLIAGAQAWVTCCDNGELRYWNDVAEKKADGFQTLNPSHKGPVVSAAWSEDGQWLATLGGGEALVWDCRRTRPTLMFTIDLDAERPSHILFSPGSYFLATFGRNAAPRLWDVSNWTASWYVALTVYDEKEPKERDMWIQDRQAFSQKDKRPIRIYRRQETTSGPQYYVTIGGPMRKKEADKIAADPSIRELSPTPYVVKGSADWTAVE